MDNPTIKRADDRKQSTINNKIFFSVKLTIPIITFYIDWNPTNSDDYRYILSLEQQKLKRQSLVTKQQRFTNRKADLLKLVNEYNNLERRIREEYAVVTALEQIYEEAKVKSYQKQVREREKLTLQQ